MSKEDHERKEKKRTWQCGNFRLTMFVILFRATRHVFGHENTQRWIYIFIKAYKFTIFEICELFVLSYIALGCGEPTISCLYRHRLWRWTVWKVIFIETHQDLGWTLHLLPSLRAGPSRPWRMSVAGGHSGMSPCSHHTQSDETTTVHQLSRSIHAMQ